MSGCRKHFKKSCRGAAPAVPQPFEAEGQSLRNGLQTQVRDSRDDLQAEMQEGIRALNERTARLLLAHTSASVLRTDLDRAGGESSRGNATVGACDSHTCAACWRIQNLSLDRTSAERTLRPNLTARAIARQPAGPRTGNGLPAGTTKKRRATEPERVAQARVAMLPPVGRPPRRSTFADLQLRRKAPPPTEAAYAKQACS